MKKVRITVLRKEFYPEYADEYIDRGTVCGSVPFTRGWG